MAGKEILHAVITAKREAKARNIKLTHLKLPSDHIEPLFRHLHEQGALTLINGKHGGHRMQVDGVIIEVAQ